MSKFGELISRKTPVLLMFYTSWNQYSNDMHIVLRDVQESFGENIYIARIDVDKNKELSEALRVKGLPTLIIYDRGEMKWRESGLKTHEELKDILTQYI